MVELDLNLLEEGGKRGGRGREGERGGVGEREGERERRRERERERERRVIRYYRKTSVFVRVHVIHMQSVHQKTVFYAEVCNLAVYIEIISKLTINCIFSHSRLLFLAKVV